MAFIITFSNKDKLSMDGFTGTFYTEPDYSGDVEEIPNSWRITVENEKLYYSNDESDMSGDYELQETNILKMSLKEDFVYVTLNDLLICGFSIVPLDGVREINITGDYERVFNTLFNQIDIIRR